MNGDFYLVTTNDGSISLFNNDVDDIYHSSIGAYTEAINKFVLPSGILEFAKTNNEISILDICYGLGYNSRSAVSEILKINPNCKINIDCLEIDEKVLTLSALIKISQIDDNILGNFNKNLVRNSKIKKIVNDDNFVKNYSEAINENFYKIAKFGSKKRFAYHKNANLNAFLHNIYYKTDLKRNISSKYMMNLNKNLKINFEIDDARASIQKLNRKYDFIFHDGFTPAKLPTLWSVEFFEKLYRLLNENGNITTYSNSAAIRGAMKEVGFSLGCNRMENGKAYGTSAYKNPKLIKHPLTQKEKGLLDTRAGIPYRDSELQLDSKEILNLREHEVKNSSRISSSRYLKTYSA